ncbi:MAG: hypothetical protein ACK5JS_02875 [Mangrovibacterium sp.]
MKSLYLPEFNEEKMEQQLFLTLSSSSQWGIFIAICLLIYGKVDSKPKMKKIAQAIFVAFGIFSLCILFGNVVEVPEVMDGASVPKEAKLLTFFVGLSLNGLLGAVALLLNLMGNNKVQRILNAMLLLGSLLLFFMVYNLQKM